MAVPKKKKSKSKRNHRYAVWKGKAALAAQKAMSIGKSVLTGKAQGFVYPIEEESEEWLGYEPNLKASNIIAYVAPIRTLSTKDQTLKKLELEEGLILIIISIIKIIIGTIINSFRPSLMNLVTKFANKKYPVKTEIILIDFDFQEELKKPNNNLLSCSFFIENLVFCMLKSQ